MDYTVDLIERIPETIRPKGDSPAEQILKFKHHREANGILKYYIEKCDYLSAYTVAFSLLEDRVRATAIVKKRDLLNSTDFEKYASMKLGHVADFIYQKSPKHKIFLQNLKSAFFNRNKLIHEAMWRVNAICLRDIEIVIELRDIVASDLRALKRQITYNNKNLTA
ncbi:MAG: hypothetical protein E6Q68_05040 [Polynucleobacter sp.]|nr:MAG: hypothetical protein E6Q68_05040 [Polynucleobacter sp.]